MRSFLSYLLILFLVASTSFSQNKVVVKKPIKFAKTPPLSSITPIPPQDRVQAWKIMKKMIPNPSLEKGKNVDNLTGMDPVLQREMGTKKISTKDMTNFEGVGNVDGVAPPDNMGDIGPSNYFQMINLSFAIFNKNGRMLYGPAANSTLWQNLPGPWSGSNDGDPIVNYDEMAGRWVVSQFALPNLPDGPYYELVAVSATSDPQGEWYLYAFQLDDMPDYPKLGVWPDAYYMSVNSFSAGSLSFMGAGVAALERDKMLAGDSTAQMIFYQQSSSVYSLLPADLDGTNTPPAGTPGIFAELGTSSLNIYNFIVDWDNPSNSMFVGPTPLPIESYSDICTSRDCVPQAGTSDRLDALSGRLMFRLQYRYFGENDERMVTNHTVDNGSGVAAIRWYELRNNGNGWTVYQQGTYSPDDTWRWMGSIAMDVNGNIALGYSASSSSITPEIRMTGRYANDPLGQMTIQEVTIMQSPSAQTSVNRWGDYTNMTVDPTDGVTFWYTNEYSNGGWDWGTRIAGLTFEIDNTPPAAINDLAVTGALSNTVTLQWTATGDDGTDGTASRYDIRYSTTPMTEDQWDSYPQFENDMIPQASGSTETITVTGLDFATTYYFAVRAVDNLGNYSPISNTPTGTTDNPPVISVNPTTLSANLLTGQTQDATFDISNDASAGSNLEYYIEIRPGSQTFPKNSVPQKKLTDAQKQKLATDINKRGNGIYPKMYALASKDDLLIDETFDNGVPPADWTVVDNAGTGVVWKTDSEWGEGNYTGGEGFSACASSDAAGHVMFDTELWTPEINIMGRRDIYLDYLANFQDLGNSDYLDVDLSFDGGQTWTTVLSWNEDHGTLHGTPGEEVTLLLDDYIPTAAANMIIRWHYHTTDTDPWQWYAEIDNVQLVAGGSAWLTVNPLEGNVGIGQIATTNVTFSALGMYGGTYNAAVVVISNDPANPEVPVNCTLDVTGVADIDVTPDSIQYGTLFVNQKDSAVVTVANLGTDDLTISSITFDNTDYSASDNAFVLAAGESRDVMVYLMPTHTGEDNGVMTITSDDVDEGTVNVYLFGFGSDAPVVDVQPTSLSADLLTGQTQDTSFTVSNVGTTTSELQYMVSIEYQGKNAVSKPLTPAQIEKNRLDNGKRVGHGKYQPMYLLGRKDETLLSADFENGVPPTDWTVVDNAGTGVVWKTNSEWNEGNYTGGEGESACASSDAAGHIMFDTELWTPTINVAGRQDLYLTYKANFQDLGNSDYLDVDLSFDGGQNWTTVLSWNEDHGTLHGTPGEDVSILLDNFIPVGSSNMIIRWHYHTTDSDPWQWYAEIDDVQLVGGSAWLAVNPLEGALMNGESATHAVTFNAAGMFGGDYNANIVVYNNDPLNPAVPIATNLHVTGVADIDVDSTMLDYGNVFVNGTYTKTFHVINAGTDVLTISGLSVDEPAFTVPTDGFALNPGESQEITVTFAPTNAQTYTGTITINSDDPDEPTVTVSLAGVAQNPPVIGVDPTSVSADLITGETDNATFTISNTGEADLNYSIDVEYTGAPLKARISKVHLPPSDGNFPRGKAAPSFMPAPKHNTKAHSNGAKGSTAYASDLFSSMYQTFDTDDPSTTNDLFSVTSLFAGAISHNDNNLAYGVDYDNNHLYKLDISAGTTEDLGNVTGYQGSGEVATGMAFFGDVCYLATYGTASNLYTLDVETATATYVGTITDGIIIAIAADDDGLYGLDLSNDILVSIDPNTGVGTEIGSIGYDANYAQGMGFDHDSGEMYIAAYNNASSQGELRVVDRTTGNTMLIAPLANGDEYDMISFMGASGGAWLTLDNYEGTIPQGGSVQVTVTFDASDLVGGQYTANINIASNDPVNPLVAVDASMHVQGAPNLETEPTEMHFGDIFIGYTTTRDIIVSNTGTDDLVISGATIDNNQFSLENVSFPITLTSGNSVVWTVDATPTQLGEISGTLAISSNDANDPVYNVPLTANVLQPPVAEFSTTNIEETLPQGSTSERTFTISNTGGSPLDFSIDTEILSKSSETVDIHLRESYPTANSFSKRKVTPPSMIDEQNYTVNKGLNGPKSGVSVLILSPDPYSDYVSSLYDALSSFDDLEVTHYPEDQLANLTLDDLTPYQVVIIQNDYKWSAAGADVNTVGDLIADYIDQGGKVIADMYIYSYDEWGFGGRFISDGYGPFTGTTSDIWGEGTLGTVYEPNHPIMSGVNAINDTWGHQDPGLATDAIRIADWNDGQPMIAVNDNVVAFNILPINENGIWSSDIATLIHNAIVWLGGANWLTVDPTEGVVDNGKGSVDITVGFNAEDLDPGDYSAVLHVTTNDPEHQLTDINISLGVLSGVGDEIGGIPTEFKLSQNYPNPFNPSTIITYAVPVNSKVTLKIFDILGREITTLVNKQVEAGTYRVQFNAHNLTSGVYFYAIRAEGENGKMFIDAKKFILMK